MNGRVKTTREWLAHQKASPTLIKLAAQAIDNYELIVGSPEDAGLALTKLHEAALHSRKLVWDVALPLLAALAATHSTPRDYLSEMATSSRVQIRERSIRYLGGLSRKFCTQTVSRLLSDRSAKIRVLAATRVECLDLTELQPKLQAMAQHEADSDTRDVIQLKSDLMQHGFTKLTTGRYTILVRVTPGYHVCISQFDNQQLTPTLIKKIGIRTIRDKLADSPAAKVAHRISAGA